MLTINHNRIAVNILDIVIVIKRYHTIFNTHIMQILVLVLVECLVREWAAADSDVIEKATWATIRGVDGAEETPAFG